MGFQGFGTKGFNSLEGFGTEGFNSLENACYLLDLPREAVGAYSASAGDFEMRIFISKIELVFRPKQRADAVPFEADPFF